MIFGSLRAVFLVVALTPFAASAGETASTALDVPIERIADTPNGCAILDKDFPGMRAHPMYGSFKSMTLNQIAAMSKGQITPDMLAQAKADLATLDMTAPVPASAVSTQP